METTMLSEGFPVRHGYQDNRYDTPRRMTAMEHAMGTYTPRILRNAEFSVGRTPSVVEASFHAPAPKTLNRRPAPIPNEVFVVINSPDDPAAGLNESQENLSNFEETEIFKSMITLFYTMSVFGLCKTCTYKTTKWRRIAITLWQCLVSLILISNTVRLFCCFDIGEETMSGFPLKSCVVGWFTFGALSAASTQWTWQNHGVQLFCVQMNSLIKPSARSRSRLKMLSLCCSIGGYILILCLVGFGIYTAFSPGEQFFIGGIDLTVCPARSSPSRIALKVLFMVSLFLSSASWIFPLFQLSLFSYLLHTELRRFRNLLEKALAGRANVYRYLESYRHRHLAFGDAIERADNLLEVYLSVGLVLSLLTCLTLIGYLSLTSVGNGLQGTSGVFLTLATIVMTVILTCGVLVNSSWRGPALSLPRYYVVSASSENCLQMSLFLNQLTTGSRGFRVFRLFVITKTSVIIIVSAILCYLTCLVIVGSHKEDEQQSVPFINATQMYPGRLSDLSHPEGGRISTGLRLA